MNYPKKVKISEVLLRDGIQSEMFSMKTETKLFFVKKFSEIGFREIEIGSFGHPKYLPQFNDIELLLEQISNLNLKSNLIIKALTTTRKAVERAVNIKKKGFGLDKISFVTSASEEHALYNMHRSNEQLFKELPDMIKMAKNYGIETSLSISTAFGCPITKKKVPIENSLRIIEKALKLGIGGVKPADTTGEALPHDVYKYYVRLREEFGNNNVHWAHFHNNRGLANANYLAALQAGVTNLDSSLGGIGGQPSFIVDGVPGKGTGGKYTKGLQVGNASTEDLALMLEGMGIDTGLNINELIECGQILEDVLGRRLNSYSVDNGILY